MNDFIHREALGILRDDDPIGSGVARKVYNSPLFPDCVVKIENTAGSFQNVIEWNTWLNVKDTKRAKWFAPCVAISPCGGILIQKKTQPAVKFPTRLPKFLGDTKPSNYGMYQGRFVCHDYGFDYFLKGGLSPGLVEAVWADDTGAIIIGK